MGREKSVMMMIDVLDVQSDQPGPSNRDFDASDFLTFGWRKLCWSIEASEIECRPQDSQICSTQDFCVSRA